ncbi:twin-arginine translocation signal domain-containing protein [Deefgea sp. CFH1-16]|uniref:twin-arginine translocation signal domain-containing protein n=1 Tax=Deefgea sp. CFH1-16 TaxID=2675457 RepID=UPI001FFCA5F8|nr:twin-arginine translocation signal domain-containing protein [Deefgea sp. CFH1-16]
MSLDRRDFIKISAVTAAAASAGIPLAQAAPAKTLPAMAGDGKDAIRWTKRLVVSVVLAVLS